MRETRDGLEGDDPRPKQAFEAAYFCYRYFKGDKATAAELQRLWEAGSDPHHLPRSQRALRLMKPESDRLFQLGVQRVLLVDYPTRQAYGIPGGDIIVGIPPDDGDEPFALSDDVVQAALVPDAGQGEDS